MRILHIVHQYVPEHIGGTELYTQTLAQHQIAAGHSVAVFYPSLSDEAPPKTPVIDEVGVRLYGIPIGQRSRTQVFRDTFSNQKLEAAFTAVLSTEEPDIIHIQHLMGLPLSLAHHINQAGIPYLVTLHDYWYLCANAQLLTNYNNTVCKGPNLWLNCAHCALARAGYNSIVPLIPAIAPLFGYRERRLRRILDGADLLVAPTQFTAAVYQQMGISAAKIRVVPHGINIPDKLPLRTPSDSELHIAYIGGLSQQKGVHILIAAVNQLPAAGVKLSIIGDTTAFPDYVSQLKQQAQHSGISFNGRIPPTELWMTLARVDLVVVPSLWYETASLIVQEAFAAKVPVIASHIGALQERVEERVNGRFFPPGDSSALTQILLEFYHDKSQLEYLRAGIKPVYTIKEHLQDIESIYTQIIQ